MMASLPFSLVCFSFFLLFCSLCPVSTSRTAQLIFQVYRTTNETASRRRSTAELSCNTGNPIDDCWRCDPNWASNRQRLADCAVGFGKDAIGGKYGQIYVVMDPSDDDAVNPRPGTLRHAVIQKEPLWIVFANDMTITLKQELLMNSYKTIDGRGAIVHIAGGPCITIQYVSNIIIHGLHIHDCQQGGNALVRDSPDHYGWRTITDGDGISIFGGRNVWIDHNTLYNCHDGLVDAIHGSTAITISNNHFSQHNKVMLLGHNNDFADDRNMQVTVAYNHFGEGLVQRMPRCRLGYCHVVNNDYTHWGLYAIGGSGNPTIYSQANRFVAPVQKSKKQVTRREYAPQNEWSTWNWTSVGDLFLNGAYFVPSGDVAASTYVRASNPVARSANLVAMITAQAGALQCRPDAYC